MENFEKYSHVKSNEEGQFIIRLKSTNKLVASVQGSNIIMLNGKPEEEEEVRQYCITQRLFNKFKISNTYTVLEDIDDGEPVAAVRDKQIFFFDNWTDDMKEVELEVRQYCIEKGLCDEVTGLKHEMVQGNVMIMKENGWPVAVVRRSEDLEELNFLGTDEVSEVDIRLYCIKNKLFE